VKDASEATVEHRRCADCGGEFPEDKDHFYWESRGTWDCYCIDCRRRRSREAWHRSQAKKREATDARVDNGETSETIVQAEPDPVEPFGEDTLVFPILSEEQVKPWSSPTVRRCIRCGMVKPREFFGPDGDSQVCHRCAAAEQNARKILRIDLTGHPEIYDALAKAADRDLRDVDKQAIWTLKQTFTNWEGVV